MSSAQAARKRRGEWYTPPELIDVVVTWLLTDFDPPVGRPLRVLDPACGDGRFLFEIAERLDARGISVSLTGCDINESALPEETPWPVLNLQVDALTHDWGDAQYDVVVGNPPFLSQMAALTSRGGSSRFGGGPYADGAAEFLALAVRLADRDHGRVALILPQSILGARDAAPIRAGVSQMADLVWSWWQPRQQHFDAAVNVCAVGLRRPATGNSMRWNSVVTDRLGVPELDVGTLDTAGTVGDRARATANFRDEYYALVPAVSDTADGPALITSGLIDPGRCRWGELPVTFAKCRFEHPRVDVALLTGRFSSWATSKLVPKVLVANQTRVLEAVADPQGVWLPGVPVNSVTPLTSLDVHELAALLTSPVASVVAWQIAAGTGLSTTTIRITPSLLESLPWPTGDLGRAAGALAAGDIVGCGHLVGLAFGLDDDMAQAMLNWWEHLLPRPR